MGGIGALEIRNQREQAVRAAVAWRRRGCKSMAPLQRGRGDRRRAEGARYRSARWTSGRSGSGNFDAVPQLAADAEGSCSTEEGQGAWDGRCWRLVRSKCYRPNDLRTTKDTPKTPDLSNTTTKRYPEGFHAEGFQLPNPNGRRNGEPRRPTRRNGEPRTRAGREGARAD